MNTLADVNVRRRDLYKGIVTLLLLVAIVILVFTRPVSPEAPAEPAPEAQAPALVEPTAPPATAVPPTAMPAVRPTAVPATPAPTVPPTAVAVSPSIQSVRTSATGEINLDGTGQPGSSLELWSGSSIGSVVVNNDGKWSFSGQLPAGDYQVVARMVDTNGSVLQESAVAHMQLPQPLTATAPAEASGGTPADGTEASPTVQASADGFEYLIQSGDSLVQLAQEYLGDGSLYMEIVAATNAKAATDSSFTTITDPAVLDIDQKIWIPARPAGQ